MANRKKKSVVDSGCSGVSGVFDELYARGQSGGGEPQGASHARAHVLTELVESPESDRSLTENLKAESADSPAPVLTPVEENNRSHRSQEPDSLPGLDVPVAVWADLPAPASLRVRTTTGRTAWFTASRKRLSEAASAREAAFGPNEYEAAVVGLREGRATLTDLDRWIDRKLATPDWRLSAMQAVGGAAGLLREPGSSRVRPDLLSSMTWERALAGMGCTAVEVVVEDAPAPESISAKGEEFSSL